MLRRQLLWQHRSPGAILFTTSCAAAQLLLASLATDEGLATGEGLQEVGAGLRRSTRVSRAPLAWYLNDFKKFARPHQSAPTLLAQCFYGLHACGGSPAPVCTHRRSGCTQACPPSRTMSRTSRPRPGSLRMGGGILSSGALDIQLEMQPGSGCRLSTLYWPDNVYTRLV